MMHTFKADSIQLSFGERIILSGAYLHNETGKISALLGRNGTGKSCFFKIITGDIITENKAVNIDNSSYFYAKNKNELISFLPQFNIVPNSLTITHLFKNFHVPLEKLITPFPQFEKLINNRIGNLSSGERRLVELLSVIYHPSYFSILDEPFTALTPLVINKVKEILVKEKEKKGFIVSDHLYRHVIDISDNIYLLSNGYVQKIHQLSDLEKFGYARL